MTEHLRVEGVDGVLSVEENVNSPKPVRMEIESVGR